MNSIINKNDKQYILQKGGTHYPTGGFPPIYLCENKDPIEDIAKEDEKKRREYISHQTTVKIQDILKKRRGAIPYCCRNKISIN